MTRRLTVPGAVVAAAVLAGSAAAQPTPSPASGRALIVEGAGAAHGMGLAMDGVLGQARAGWSYDRILSLFYVGATPGRASGPVRVGLASGTAHAMVLPGGGTVDGDGDGFPVRVPAGGRVVVRWLDGRYAVEAPGIVGSAQAGDLVPVETPAPPTPSPVPTATPAPSTSPAPGLRSTGPVWVTPDGSPALVRLESTGRRYRGRMQLRHSADGGLWAINHVDLETYVQGIAEEKGAGWPVEGLKVLAVAARSLAEATKTWYAKHHHKGFDICPTSMCQVYLGYDGEEGTMTQATRATAGEIRVWEGRPILAMYHGNGGGQTEAYRWLMPDGAPDPHPYLRSIRYPFAKPRRWSVTFTGEQMAAALGVPGPVERVEILERGESPRVKRLRVHPAGRELSGLAFQHALDLRSAWFDVRTAEPGTVAATAPPPTAEPFTAGPVLDLPSAWETSGTAAPPSPPARSLPLTALAALLGAAATAAAPLSRSPRPPARGGTR